MRPLFVSYAREDTPMVEPLVMCLRERGFMVNWDNDLPFGKRYREVLRAQIEAADRVIVAWTRASVDSLWVQQEADLAFKEGKLLPLRFETVEPPMPFGAIQSGDFTEWDRTIDAACFVRLVSELDAPRPSLIPNPSGGSAPPVVIRRGAARPSSQHLSLILASFAAMAVAVPTLYHLMVHPDASVTKPITGEKPPAPTSTVIPSDVIGPFAAAGTGDHATPGPPTGVPAPPPAPHPTSPPPPRECCHATGGKLQLPCPKLRCSECGGVECPK